MPRCAGHGSDATKLDEKGGCVASLILSFICDSAVGGKLHRAGLFIGAVDQVRYAITTCHPSGHLEPGAVVEILKSSIVWF
jgi:hypothetical protein